MDEVSVEIAAPPAKVWGLVADFANMGRWSPELVSCRWLDGATQPEVGAKFKGTNYRFEPTDQGGTRVTEYREKTREIPFYVKIVQRSGLIGRNREALMLDGMRETLARLKEAAEA